jgi:REP element-mobilizing transposase RayT
MSFISLNYHIVFSTKERRAFVRDDVAERLHAYLGGTVAELDGVALAVGGVADHVHIVASLSAKRALMDVLRDLKANSSRWVHENFRDLPDFDWQDGYSAFSVSASVLPKVVDYVRGQREHHRKMTFQEELIALLKRHGVKYDERYIFG